MYLNCKTFFSLLYGTIKTEELVLVAASYSVDTLALTNINTTADAWDFVDYCCKNGIKPVLGAEIRNDGKFCYVLLAKNNEGFLQINRFLSTHLQEKNPFPEKYPGNSNVFAIYPLGKFAPETLEADELIGVQPVEVNKLYGVVTASYLEKFVIRHPVTFQDKKYFNAHRLLRAIDRNILLSRQQKDDVAAVHETFMPPSELLNAFHSYPHIITNTLNTLRACNIEMEFRKDKTKKVYSISAEDDRILLERLALEGMSHRFEKNNYQAIERVKKELRIINNMGFNAYFLITWDILQYARSRGFFYVGRGSGANSIVAYCLEITDVDPLDLDLYFERFLNPHRSVPPDFDIDFSWADRDEIIDYVFKRFGSAHVSLLGAYATFQNRAIIRELGKVFGLPKEEIDALEHPSGNFRQDAISKQILFYSRLIKDFPHHLSIHAGGMLVSDAPVHQYSVTVMPPKGFPTAAIDMFIAEKIGLFKLDILSQRGLGHIKDTVEL
ncbi:MAG: PHP domain-containing protein, partial [Chitinophagaceae bacterium]|nr:PHP domain-containing protein [Chitinophagaceae bacterium]